MMCSIDGCTKQASKREMCNAHYLRWWRNGDALAGYTPHGEQRRFLEALSAVHDADKCITWPYQRDAKGYGKIYLDRRKRLVHRVICELVHGAPPTKAHHAAHLCGGGKNGCINPHHLRWKTPAENEADKIAHGTSNRGSRCGSAILTEQQVCEIRGLKGRKSQADIAQSFGVSRTTVSAIQSGRNWAWL